MPLLNTKLYIPPPRPNLVRRPRLVERLDEGLQLGKKLTLVSAPAGFGKTTILSEWVASVDRPVGWITVDESDNDPVRFWSYLVAALQTIQPDIGGSVLQALQSPQPLSIRTVLTGLINQTTQLPAPVILVLDDLHAIAAPEITSDLSFLLDNLSPRMHLVVSTRTDPPWPLGRMRAGGEMIELRIEDLRFTINEVTAFLNDVMKLELSPENVVALDTRIEGWVAGLQMVALSMQGRDPSSFIQAFSGSHRFILDYLLEEVLEGQPPEIQEFLLKTSILDRLTAPLCEAVLEIGRQKTEVRSKKSDEGSRAQEGDVRSPASDLRLPTSACQTLLERLESSNMFVVPLDDERRWYRYHHLFADLLRVRLSQAQPEQTSELHRRASDWYEGSGLIADAVRHALGQVTMSGRPAWLRATPWPLWTTASCPLCWNGCRPCRIRSRAPGPGCVSPMPGRWLIPVRWKGSSRYLSVPKLDWPGPMEQGVRYREGTEPTRITSWATLLPSAASVPGWRETRRALRNSPKSPWTNCPSTM